MQMHRPIHKYIYFFCMYVVWYPYLLCGKKLTLGSPRTVAVVEKTFARHRRSRSSHKICVNKKQ